MTLWPVIVRELRAQSRQPATYWLRLVAAGIVFAVFALVLLRIEQQLANSKGAGATLSAFGAQAFGHLNATMFLCTMVLAPLLTADCISRERREGTLGLLFLTRLGAGGIVTAKGFVYTLRGLVLFCAMLPFLAVPMLIGGVSERDFLMALLIDGTVLLLGLSAGLLASAFNRDWIRSFVIAEILSACFVYLFMLQHAAFVSSLTGAPLVVFNGSSFASQVIGLFSFHANSADVVTRPTGAFVVAYYGNPAGFSMPVMTTTFNGRWAGIWAMSPAVHTQWFLCIFGCLVEALMFLLLAIGLAARRVSRSWREEPVARKLVRIRKALTTPVVAVKTLRGRLARSLDRNPVGWLQHYSWSGRITKWGWFAFIIAAESFLIADFWDFGDMQPGIAVVLLCGMAFASAASFRKERESGALELLLVCPLSVAQLMWGRLRGLWMQFLPSVLFLSFCIFLGAEIQSYRHRDVEVFVFFLTFLAMFASVPVIGLFLSLHMTNFLPAWLWTMAFGVGVPCLTLGREPVLQLMALYVQCGLGLMAWLFLRDNLTERNFVLHS